MTQILTTAGNPVVGHVISVKFKYDGVSRIVDNIDWPMGSKIITGFEMRRGGKFSYKIKRYKTEKIKNMYQIAPLHREGPKIGRPTA